MEELIYGTWFSAKGSVNVSDVLAVLLVMTTYIFLRWYSQSGSATRLNTFRKQMPHQDAHIGDADNTEQYVQTSGVGSTSQQDQVVPNPDPLLDFDLATANMRDYVYENRTLRYPYFQTMSHRPMHINDWIEIDKEYLSYLERKKRVIEEHAPDVLLSLPENDDACAELLETLVDYLPRRYPTLFDRVGPDVQGSSVGGILNKATGEQFDITDVRGTDALRIVSRLVKDDFLMARERDDGQIYLVGGLVAFPGFYLLSKKLGQPLSALHAPVPHFAAKMGMSVERTLLRFNPASPFERSSWSIADDDDLFWHNIISAPLRPNQRPEDLYLRICHQTFRKLPRSKGIMFGVHPILRKIKDLADSPLIPALLAKIHTDSNQEMMDYKMANKYTGVLVPYLQQLTAQQIERGIVRPEDQENVADFRRLAQQRPEEKV